jgi:hypothetical protein
VLFCCLWTETDIALSWESKCVRNCMYLVLTINMFWLIDFSLLCDWLNNKAGWFISRMKKFVKTDSVNMKVAVCGMWRHMVWCTNTKRLQGTCCFQLQTLLSEDGGTVFLRNFRVYQTTSRYVMSRKSIILKLERPSDAAIHNLYAWFQVSDSI